MPGAARFFTVPYTLNSCKNCQGNFHLVKHSYLRTLLYVLLFMNILPSYWEWAEISTIIMTQGHRWKHCMHWELCGAEILVCERQGLCVRLALAAPSLFTTFPLCSPRAYVAVCPSRAVTIQGGTEGKERKQTLTPYSRTKAGFKCNRVCVPVWDPRSVWWTTWLSLLTLKSPWAVGSRQSQCPRRALRGTVMSTKVSVLSADASACC